MSANSDTGRRVHLRNGAHGYGVVTKVLHWLTVAALVVQFGVGWTMDLDEGFDREEDLLDAEADQREEAAEALGEAEEERAEAESERLEEEFEAREDDQAGGVFQDVLDGDGFALPHLHVLLGLFVIVLAAVRMVWRRTTPLPPWAEYLSAGERRLEAFLEKALLALLVLTPATGLLLVAGEDDWLPLHVAAQIALLAAIAGHVGLVLRHTVVRRDRHLARML